VQAFLDRLVLADIGEDAYIMGDLARSVANGIDMQPLRIDLAILAPVQYLPAPDAALLEGRPHGPVKIRPVVARTENLRCFIPDILQGIACGGGKSTVDRNDAGLRVGHHDAFAGGFENRGCDAAVIEFNLQQPDQGGAFLAQQVLGFGEGGKQGGAGDHAEELALDVQHRKKILPRALQEVDRLFQGGLFSQRVGRAQVDKAGKKPVGEERCLFFRNQSKEALVFEHREYPHVASGIRQLLVTLVGTNTHRERGKGAAQCRPGAHWYPVSIRIFRGGTGISSEPIVGELIRRMSRQGERAG
jgi:hypothetical protein